MSNVRAAAFAVVALCWAAAGAAQAPSASQKGQTLVLTNGHVRLAYDLKLGRYDVLDARGEGVRGAVCRWGSWSSDALGTRRTWTARRVRDALGSGLTVRVTTARAGWPKLMLEATLYDGKGFLVLNGGLQNVTAQPVRVTEVRPLSAGLLTMARGAKRPQTLDGYSGAIQTEVKPGLYRTSNNNLLLTFVAGGKRRSLTAGGLTYHELCKSVSVEPTPEDRADRLRARGKLTGYMDCGGSAGFGGIRTVKGTPYTFGGDPGTPWANTILFDDKQVVFELGGLGASKAYTLGFTWWDQNGDGRRESVRAVGGPELVSSTLLPVKAPEERCVALPSSAIHGDKCQVAFSNDGRAPNAVVSEVWLWEGATRPAAPVKGEAAAYLNLTASDPVGRLVEPGETWAPDDAFVVDLTTADPFEALEAYAGRVKVAQGCKPNLYDFPTVCAWYAGVWKTPGAQNHPGKSRYGIATTPGLVEEADKMALSGFLNYSRAAGRLVPDNYTENNPQGWWDDAHWQREGFYVAPYETSQRWGAAMHKRGALAFTYFQAAAQAESRDFRESHRALLLGEDVARNLDYTKPAARAYMNGVYAKMRGAVDGMMFDYCDDLWTAEAARGGFWDKHVTATAFYRRCMQLAKSGLGPNSWIHERALWQPGYDIALGISDSQRTSGDTDKIDAAMVSRSGLRWYKNRTLISYDMDSKELFSAWKEEGFGGTERDGRRMLLTMAYVAASRLLIANSFRDLPAEVLWDLERTFPYPKAAGSARPADAFSGEGWPHVYDQAIDPTWHVVTLYNGDLPTRPRTFAVPLAKAQVDGGLGLDAGDRYHVYDFWNDQYVGIVNGNGLLHQGLRPGEARVLAVHRVEDHPQFISTNRHIMQGLLDMATRPRWDARSRSLCGVSRVVAGETYKVVVALNGFGLPKAKAVGARSQIVSKPNGLAVLSIDSPVNADVRWELAFSAQPQSSTKH